MIQWRWVDNLIRGVTEPTPIEYHVWLLLVRKIHHLICFCHSPEQYQLSMMGSPSSSIHWTPLLLKISCQHRRNLFALIWPSQVLWQSPALMKNSCYQTRNVLSGILMSSSGNPQLFTSCWLVHHEMTSIMVFKDEIIFATAVDDNLEFTSDDIFFEDGLCIPFSTHFYPHHDESTIQDVFKGLTL